MASLLESTRAFFYKRRKPLLVIGGLAGGCYLAGKYALDKLRQVQSRMVEDRRDKENLRRRFAQNQEDCTFTILALLPTLGDQLFEKMNVEELTSLLQKSRAPIPVAAVPSSSETADTANPETIAHPGSSAAEAQTEAPKPADPQVETEGTAGADAEPATYAEAAARAAPESNTNTTEAQSENKPYEVDGKQQENATENSSEEVPQSTEPAAVPDSAAADVEGAEKLEAESSEKKQEAPSEAADSRAVDGEATAAPAEAEADAPKLPASTSALDSIGLPPPPPIRPGARLTPVEPQNATFASPVPEPAADDDAQAAPAPATAPASTESQQVTEDKKAKLALWNELKVVAFSRTLTSIYSIVLLAMQTHIQLNLIGRYAYLASVASLAKPAPADHKIDLLDHSAAGHDEDRTTSLADGGLMHETERVYLTFSWWFLHRGWEIVSDRVRGAVEETFGKIPLKTQLSYADFERKLEGARKKIEYEILGEEAPQSTEESKEMTGKSSAVSEVSATTRGTKRILARRLNFLEALFPTTMEEELSVLISAGAVPASTPVAAIAADTHLRQLLDETKDFIDSRDFRIVLRLCIDRAFEVFRDALKPTFGIYPLDEDEQDEQQFAIAGSRFQELGPEGEIGRKVRLAALFPAVAKQSQLAIHGVPNEYVDCLSEIKELRALSAVIYSAWPKNA